MSDVSLTEAQRASLTALQRTNSVADRSSQNLTTGRRVNDVNDDPVAFFIAQQLSQEGAAFAQRREEIDQGISALRVTNGAIDTIEQFSRQLEGIAEAARSVTDPNQLSQLEQQFQEIGRQIANVAGDASFGGVNLLTSTNNQLNVQFSDNEGSELNVQGVDVLNGGGFGAGAFSDGEIQIDQLGVTGGTFASFLSNPEEVDGLIGNIRDSIGRLRGQAQSFGSNVALLQERASFNQNVANELQAGADNLTLADLNEEAANLVAARTRTQLGTQTLGISGGQQSSILQILEGIG
ncbi:hypothetical protein [Hwanghaeella sp.]|uniref:flagellin N-terminal helical domain-containing protein n=1 Tax=Hwanghaeella sp. TaxID=2605943 RepID=UPI003CCB90F9